MDVIFDIDGTLANAEHRLHHIIPDPNQIYEQPFKKDWETFLSDELVAGDTPIEAAWAVLTALLKANHRIVFITGRPEKQRDVTLEWLTREFCPHRTTLRACWFVMSSHHQYARVPRLYMRTDGDRRPSHVVKQELLQRARKDGFDPQLVFEDRADDTAMWRSEGLLCCQVAVGDY